MARKTTGNGASIINAIAIPGELQDLASNWYDGVESMLYAIASTDGLTLGSMRPSSHETSAQGIVHRPLSNLEWYASLFSSLASELWQCARAERMIGGEDEEELTRWAQWADKRAELIDRMAWEHTKQGIYATKKMIERWYLRLWDHVTIYRGFPRHGWDYPTLRTTFPGYFPARDRLRELSRGAEV